MSIARPIYTLQYRQDVPVFNLTHSRVIYEVLDLNTQLDESENGDPLYTGTFSVELFEIKKAIKEVIENSYYQSKFGRGNVARAEKTMKDWLKAMKQSKENSLTFKCE